jgi:P4 family phage/plasmid primase-like protien
VATIIEPSLPRKKSSKKSVCERYGLDDNGNADRLVVRYADRVRWVSDNARWAVYDNRTGLWQPYGANPSAKGLMRKALERARIEERPAWKGDDQEKFVKFISRSGNNGTLDSAMGVAQTKRSLVCRMEDFDKDTDLLHVANGVIRLSTGELLPHSPEYMLTVGAAVAYSKSSRSKDFTDYLRKFLPDLELRRYVQKLVGYSLLAGNPERLLLVCLGQSSSGKSTLNELFTQVLGGYARAIELSTFKSSPKPGAPRSDLAAALNARYISATEASQELRLHADQIKRITGGDTMEARHVGEKAYVRRRPAFTPWIFTNQMPQIQGRDVAFDRRLRVIPFQVSVATNGQEIHGRTEKMLHDPVTLEHFLLWALQGLKRYREEGLVPPESVLEYTKEAAGDLSDKDRFIYECCKEGPDEWIMPAEIYQRYREWCEDNHIPSKDVDSNTKFGAYLTGRGWNKKPKRIGGKVQTPRFGVSLLPRVYGVTG